MWIKSKVAAAFPAASLLSAGLEEGFFGLTHDAHDIPHRDITHEGLLIC